MSKERELLNRSRYNLDREYCADLIDEIQELLAQAEQDNIQYLLDQVARLTAENAMLKEKWLPQPEPEQEPVAWLHEGIDETGETVRSIYHHFYEHANLIPLYTAPPKRKPIFNYTAPDYITGEYLEAYDLGFRDAEKAHGIGVGNV